MRNFWLALAKHRQKIFVLALLLAAFGCLGFSSSDLTGIYILAALAVIIIISVFCVHPDWGLYLMAALFPFTYLNFVSGGLNAPYVDVIALLLFVALILRKLYLHLSHKQKISWRDFPGWFFMLMFVIACVLSLQNVDYEFLGGSIKYIFRPIIFFYLMYVILPFNIIDDFKKLYVFLKIDFALGIALGLMGIWSLIFPPVIGARRVLPIAIGGIFPLGANHNQLAEVFILLIPIALILFWQEKNLFWKNIYLSGAIFMSGVNLLTLSRSGWAALALEIGIMLFYKYRRQVRKVFSPYVMYFLAILLIPASILMYLLVQSGVTSDATLNRLKLIEVSFILFHKYPLFGSGIGTFTEIMSQVKWYIIEYGDALDAHGYLFKNLAETGFIGTAAFCFLIFYFVWTIYKAYKANANSQCSWLLLGFLMAVVGEFAFQLFGTSYYLAVTWLPVGLALAALKLCKVKYYSS